MEYEIKKFPNSMFKFPNSTKLKNLKFKIKNSIKGFTLIEMLIVIAIIAILSSVFLVGLTGFRSSAYDARRISDLQKVQSYLEVYYNSGRKYPAAMDWTALTTELKSGGSGISSVPNDPIPGGTYTYCAPTGDAVPQSYILAAQLSSATHSSLKESYHGDLTGYTCNPSIACGDGTAGSSAWLCVKF